MNPIPRERVPVQRTHLTFYGKSISDIKNERNIQEEDIFISMMRAQKNSSSIITNEMEWLDKKYLFLQVPAKFTIKGYMTTKDFFQEPIHESHKKVDTVFLFFLDNVKAVHVEIIRPAKSKFMNWKLFLILFLIITISVYIMIKYKIIKIPSVQKIS